MLKTFSLYKKLLTLSRVGHDQGLWGANGTLGTTSWMEGSEHV